MGALDFARQHKNPFEVLSQMSAGRFEPNVAQLSHMMSTQQAAPIPQERPNVEPPPIPQPAPANRERVGAPSDLERQRLHAARRDDAVKKRMSERRRTPQGVMPEPSTGTHGGSGDAPTQVMSFFQSKGLPPHAAAALAGHAKQESSFNPGIKGDRGASLGLFQWQGGRRRALERFAAARGTSPTDLQTQLEFAWHEMETGADPGARRALQELKSANNLEEAVAAFMHFERPQGYKPGNPRGGHGFNNRLRFAQEFAANAGGSMQADMPMSRLVDMAADTNQPGWAQRLLEDESGTGIITLLTLGEALGMDAFPMGPHEMGINPEVSDAEMIRWEEEVLRWAQELERRAKMQRMQDRMQMVPTHDQPGADPNLQEEFRRQPKGADLRTLWDSLMQDPAKVVA